MKWPARWVSSRLARGTLQLQVGGGAQRVVAVVAHLLLARYFGPDDYGRYVLVISLATLLPFVFDLGVRRTVLTRWSAESADPQARARVLAFALRASLVSALATLAAGLVVLPEMADRLYDDRGLGFLAWVLCWGTLAAVPFFLLSLLLEATRRMRAVTALESAAQVLRLAAVAAVLLYGGGLSELVGGLVVVELVKAFVSGVVVARAWRRDEPLLPPRAAIREALLTTPWAGGDLRFGLLASLSKRFSQVVLVLFPLLVGSYAGPREAGFFRIGWTLGTVPLWFVTALSRNLLPALSERRARGDHQGLRQTLAAATGAAGAFAVASGLLIALLSPWLVERVYGTDYSEVLPVVWIFLAYSILVAFGLGHESMFLVRSDLRVFTLRTLFFGILVLGAAPWAIAGYGVVGAAWLMLAGTVGVFLFDFWRTWFFVTNPELR